LVVNWQFILFIYNLCFYFPHFCDFFGGLDILKLIKHPEYYCCHVFVIVIKFEIFFFFLVDGNFIFLLFFILFYFIFLAKRKKRMTKYTM